MISLNTASSRDVHHQILWATVSGLKPIHASPPSGGTGEWGWTRESWLLNAQWLAQLCTWPVWISLWVSSLWNVECWDSSVKGPSENQPLRTYSTVAAFLSYPTPLSTYLLRCPSRKKAKIGSWALLLLGWQKVFPFWGPLRKDKGNMLCGRVSPGSNH